MHFVSACVRLCVPPPRVLNVWLWKYSTIKETKIECNAWEIVLLISTCFFLFCNFSICHCTSFRPLEWVSSQFKPIEIGINHIGIIHNLHLEFRWKFQSKIYGKNRFNLFTFSVHFSRDYFLFFFVWSHRERSVSYFFFPPFDPFFLFALAIKVSAVQTVAVRHILNDFNTNEAKKKKITQPIHIY